MRWPIAVLLVACSNASKPAEPTAPAANDYPAICKAIAEDIEALRPAYPQLTEYRADLATEQDECKIRYQWHTHAPTRAGGWTAGVPHPDPDGIWFYLGIWDPTDPAEASAQINTQPVLPPWRLGTRKITFLHLEGEQTRPVAGAIVTILRARGMTDGP
jgi:hypothetical protein